MNADEPITAWAVRCATGVSLHLQQPAAVDYATRHHGTVHCLVELIDPGPQPDAPFDAAARRMPQGELTPGGLMRI